MCRWWVHWWAVQTPLNIRIFTHISKCINLASLQKCSPVWGKSSYRQPVDNIRLVYLSFIHNFSSKWQREVYNRSGGWSKPFLTLLFSRRLNYFVLLYVFVSSSAFWALIYDANITLVHCVTCQRSIRPQLTAKLDYGPVSSWFEPFGTGFISCRLRTLETTDGFQR